MTVPCRRHMCLAIVLVLKRDGLCGELEEKDSIVWQRPAVAVCRVPRRRRVASRRTRVTMQIRIILSLMIPVPASYPCLISIPFPSSPLLPHRCSSLSPIGPVWSDPAATHIGQTSMWPFRGGPVKGDMGRASKKQASKKKSQNVV